MRDSLWVSKMTCRLIAPGDDRAARRWQFLPGRAPASAVGIWRMAVAAGRMLRDHGCHQRMRAAMGLAVSEASGFRAMHGTATVAFMPAHAGQMGLRAALAGRNEDLPPACPRWRKSPEVFFDVLHEAPIVWWAWSAVWAERFELLRNTYKAISCGIVIQPIIDACLKLRQDHAPDPDRIVSVAIEASPGAMALCNNRDPKDEMQAHVSLHHWTAVAFIRGTARIKDMDTDTAVRDPALMAFQDKVEATLNPALAGDQTEVTITMTDGARHICRIEHAIGSKVNPMSDADLERKFLGLAEPIVGATRTKELIGRTWGIGGLADAGDLARAAA